MSVKLGAHQLAFLWDLSPGDQPKLRKAVEEAKGVGATVFELMPPLLNKMSPQETARALVAGGITKAVICHFYPKDALGDPLGSGDQLAQATTAFSDVIGYGEALQAEGIEIGEIVGPSCFVLAKGYNLNQTILNGRITNFYTRFTDRLRTLNIRVAIELLRDGEDKVIRTVDNAMSIMDNLPSDIYGFHFDTFHFRDRGYDIVAAIKRFGSRIFHFHANGKGRVPPGHDLDDIQWNGAGGVVAALQEIGYNGIATNEPFCELVRQAAPELGEGLPDPIPEPAGLKMTFDKLTEFGLL